MKVNQMQSIKRERVINYALKAGRYLINENKITKFPHDETQGTIHYASFTILINQHFSRSKFLRIPLNKITLRTDSISIESLQMVKALPEVLSKNALSRGRSPRILKW